jgi:hypothetical protein
MRYGTKTGRIRSYACRILITNGLKTPAWITAKIRCVNGPYLTVYDRISAVFFDQGSAKKFINYLEALNKVQLLNHIRVIKYTPWPQPQPIV